MLFQIDRKSGEAIDQQILKKLRALISQKVLMPEEKIPSVGELATLLVINPKYVCNAYQVLEKEGLIRQADGCAFVVCTGADFIKDEKQVLILKERLSTWIKDAAELGITEHEIRLWVHNSFLLAKK